MAQTITNGSFGQCVFLVTPDKMYATSEQVLSKINSTRSRLSNISNTIRSTINYWDGDASDARRMSRSKADEETAEIFARLMEHVTELKTMAEVYVKTETAAAALAQSLPSDVIF